MKDRDSPEWPRLMPELEPWLERSLAELPAWLKERLEEAGFAIGANLSVWDELSPKHRRFRADWRDCENDPALEESRVRIWNLVNEHGEVRREIEEWEAVAAPTASDLDIKKSKLAELRKRFSKLDSELRHQRGDYIDESPTRCKRGLDPTGHIIQAVMEELNLTEPDIGRIYARLMDGRSVDGVTITTERHKNGSPVPVIAGKPLTRDALRKRLRRMFPNADG